MDPTQAIILGFIQGITEWLPISSTGHLRIVENFFGFSLPLSFDFSLHLGTLFVVLLFFRRDLKMSLMALIGKDFESENGKILPLTFVGMAPTAVIGIILVNLIEPNFSDILLIALAFLVSGTVLFLSRNRTEGTEEITYLKALAIGVAQGIAFFPGLSRSGLTIATALFLAVRKEMAFKFSFLLSVPAVSGALILTIFEENMTLEFTGIGFLEVLLGIAVSLVVGYFSLGLLKKLLVNRRFHLFGFYCWIIASILLMASLVIQ